MTPFVARLLRMYGSRRVLPHAVLGFAAGIPHALVAGTLLAWLTTLDVDLTRIGIFSLVSLPYSLKFAWAPLFDRFPLAFLGKRRGWMVVLNVAVVGSLAALGLSDPVAHPTVTAALAVLVTFTAASFDVVYDAYRTDLLEPEERAAGAATYVLGYRTAMVASGAIALVLSDHMPWRAVYLVMAGLAAVGALATPFSPEPARVPPPRTLRESVVEPFADFFRPGAAAVAALAFLMLYRLGDTVVAAMLPTFLIKLGFGRSEVGVVLNGVGTGATIVGALVGGGWVPRLGLGRALFVFGVAQAASNLGYRALAVVGPRHGLLVAAVAVDHLATGLAVAAAVAFTMALCNRRFSAAQFALVTSASGLAGRLATGYAGAWVAHLGWPALFVATMGPAAPALALLPSTMRALNRSESLES